MARRKVPDDHPPFTALPVRHVTVGGAGDRLAVHLSGVPGGGRLPLICVSGYVRNMADFSEFVGLAHRLLGRDWPVLLVDLRGRGRSSDRPRADDYATPADAADIAELARALGIEQAVLLGQGHGGQAIMALAAIRPALVAGAVLIDAGPAAEPRSLIRLRSNMQAIAGSRGPGGTVVMLRRMLLADYPGLDREALDRLAGRLQAIDAKGRAQPLFDTALIDRLRGFTHDDVIEPQWPLFELLGPVPLLLMRTELTDQLPRELAAEMARRRPDAPSLTVARQGSPALLDQIEEANAIAEFVRRAARLPERSARRA